MKPRCLIPGFDHMLDGDGRCFTCGDYFREDGSRIKPHIRLHCVRSTAFIQTSAPTKGYWNTPTVFYWATCTSARASVVSELEQSSAIALLQAWIRHTKIIERA